MDATLQEIKQLFEEILSDQFHSPSNVTKLNANFQSLFNSLANKNDFLTLILGLADESKSRDDFSAERVESFRTEIDSFFDRITKNFSIWRVSGYEDPDDLKKKNNSNIDEEGDSDNSLELRINQNLFGTQLTEENKPIITKVLEQISTFHNQKLTNRMHVLTNLRLLRMHNKISGYQKMIPLFFVLQKGIQKNLHYFYKLKEFVKPTGIAENGFRVKPDDLQKLQAELNALKKNQPLPKKEIEKLQLDIDYINKQKEGKTDSKKDIEERQREQDLQKMKEQLEAENKLKLDKQKEELISNLQEQLNQVQNNQANQDTLDELANLKKQFALLKQAAENQNIEELERIKKELDSKKKQEQLQKEKDEKLLLEQMNQKDQNAIEKENQDLLKKQKLASEQEQTKQHELDKARNELEILKHGQEDQLGELSRLRKELENLKKQYDEEKLNNLQRLKKEIESLQNQPNQEKEKADLIKKLNSELENLKNPKNKEQEKRLKDLSAELDTLKKKAESENSNLKEIDDLQKEFDRLKKEEEINKNEQLKKLQQQLEDLKKTPLTPKKLYQLYELDNNLNLLKNNLNLSKQSDLEKLKAELEQLKQQSDIDKDKELKKLQEQLESVQKQNESIQKQEEIKKLIDLQNALNNKGLTPKEQEEEKNNLLAELEKAKRLAQQQDEEEMKKLLSDLQNINQKSENQKEDDEVLKLQKQLEELKNISGEKLKEEMIARLQKQIDNLTNQCKQQDEIFQKINQKLHQAEKDKKNEEVNKLKDIFSKSLNLKKTNEDELMKLKKELLDLKNNPVIVVKNKEIEKINNQLGNLKINGAKDDINDKQKKLLDEINVLKNKIYTKNNKNQIQKLDFKDIEKQSHSKEKQNDIEKLKKQLEDELKQAQANANIEDQNNLKKQLEALKLEEEQLKNKKDQNREDIKKAQDNVDKLQNELDALKNIESLKNKEEELQRLKQQLEQLKKQQDEKLKEKQQKLQEEIESLKNGSDLKDKNQNIEQERLKAELDALKKQIDSQQNEEEMRKKLDQLNQQTQSKDKDDQINRLKKALEELKRISDQDEKEKQRKLSVDLENQKKILGNQSEVQQKKIQEELDIIKRNNDIKQKEDEMRKLKEQLEQLKKKNENDLKLNPDQQKQKEEIEKKAKEEISKLQTELDNLKKDLQKEKYEEEQKKKKENDAQKKENLQNTKLEKELNDLKKKLEDAQNKIKDAMNQKAGDSALEMRRKLEMENRYNNLIKDNQTKESMLRDQVQKLDEVESKLKALADQQLKKNQKLEGSSINQNCKFLKKTLDKYIDGLKRSTLFYLSKRAECTRISLGEVGERIKARLLIQTRNLNCGNDSRKAFLKWMVKSDSNLLRDIMTKIGVNSRLSYQVAIWRLKKLLFKPIHKLPEAVKTVRKMKGFFALINFFAIKKKFIQKYFFEKINPHFKNKKAQTTVEKILTHISERYNKEKRNILNKLRQNVNKQKNIFSRLIQKTGQEVRVCFLTLRLKAASVKNVVYVGKIVQLLSSMEKIRTRIMKETFNTIIGQKKQKLGNLFEKMNQSCHIKKLLVFNKFSNFRDKNKRQQQEQEEKKVQQERIKKNLFTKIQENLRRKLNGTLDQLRYYNGTKKQELQSKDFKKINFLNKLKQSMGLKMKYCFKSFGKLHNEIKQTAEKKQKSLSLILDKNLLKKRNALKILRDNMKKKNEINEKTKLALGKLNLKSNFKLNAVFNKLRKLLKDQKIKEDNIQYTLQKLFRKQKFDQNNLKRKVLYNLILYSKNKDKNEINNKIKKFQPIISLIQSQNSKLLEALVKLRYNKNFFSNKFCNEKEKAEKAKKLLGKYNLQRAGQLENIFKNEQVSNKKYDDLLDYIKKNNGDGRFDGLLKDIESGKIKNLQELIGAINKSDKLSNELLPILNGNKKESLKKWILNNNKDGQYSKLLDILEKNPDAKMTDIFDFISKNNKDGSLNPLLAKANNDCQLDGLIDYMTKNNQDGKYNKPLRYLSKLTNQKLTDLLHFIKGNNANGEFKNLLDKIDNADEKNKTEKQKLNDLLKFANNNNQNGLFNNLINLLQNPDAKLDDILNFINKNNKNGIYDPLKNFLIKGDNVDIFQDTLKWMENNNNNGTYHKILDDLKKIQNPNLLNLLEIVEGLPNGNLKENVLSKINEEGHQKEFEDLLDFIERNNKNGVFNPLINNLSKVKNPKISDIAAFLQTNPNPAFDALRQKINQENISAINLAKLLEANNKDGKFNDQIDFLRQHPNMTPSDILNFLNNQNKDGKMQDILDYLNKDGKDPFTVKSDNEKEFQKALDEAKQNPKLADFFDNLKKRNISDPEEILKEMLNNNKDGKFNPLIEKLNKVLESNRIYNLPLKRLSLRNQFLEKLRFCLNKLRLSTKQISELKRQQELGKKQKLQKGFFTIFPRSCKAKLEQALNKLRDIHKDTERLRIEKQQRDLNKLLFQTNWGRLLSKLSKSKLNSCFIKLRGFNQLVKLDKEKYQDKISKKNEIKQNILKKLSNNLQKDRHIKLLYYLNKLRQFNVENKAKDDINKALNNNNQEKKTEKTKNILKYFKTNSTNKLEEAFKILRDFNIQINKLNEEKTSLLNQNKQKRQNGLTKIIKKLGQGKNLKLLLCFQRLIQMNKLLKKLEVEKQKENQFEKDKKLQKTKQLLKCFKSQDDNFLRKAYQKLKENNNKQKKQEDEKLKLENDLLIKKKNLNSKLIGGLLRANYFKKQAVLLLLRKFNKDQIKNENELQKDKQILLAQANFNNNQIKKLLQLAHSNKLKDCLQKLRNNKKDLENIENNKKQNETRQQEKQKKSKKQLLSALFDGSKNKLLQCLQKLREEKNRQIADQKSIEDKQKAYKKQKVDKIQKALLIGKQARFTKLIECFMKLRQMKDFAKINNQTENEKQKLEQAKKNSIIKNLLINLPKSNSAKLSDCFNKLREKNRETQKQLDDQKNQKQENERARLQEETKKKERIEKLFKKIPIQNSFKLRDCFFKFLQHNLDLKNINNIEKLLQNAENDKKQFKNDSNNVILKKLIKDFKLRNRHLLKEYLQKLREHKNSELENLKQQQNQEELKRKEQQEQMENLKNQLRNLVKNNYNGQKEALDKLRQNNQTKKNEQEKDKLTDQKEQEKKSLRLAENIKLQKSLITGINVQLNHKLKNIFDILRKFNQKQKEIENFEQQKQDQQKQENKFKELNDEKSVKVLLKNFLIKNHSKLQDCWNKLRLNQIESKFNDQIMTAQLERENELKQLMEQERQKNIKNLIHKLPVFGRNKLKECLNQLRGHSHTQQELEKEKNKQTNDDLNAQLTKEKLQKEKIKNCLSTHLPLKSKLKILECFKKLRNHYNDCEKDSEEEKRKKEIERLDQIKRINDIIKIINKIPAFNKTKLLACLNQLRNFNRYLKEIEKEDERKMLEEQKSQKLFEEKNQQKVVGFLKRIPIQHFSKLRQCLGILMQNNSFLKQKENMEAHNEESGRLKKEFLQKQNERKINNLLKNLSKQKDSKSKQCFDKLKENNKQQKKIEDNEQLKQLETEKNQQLQKEKEKEKFNQIIQKLKLKGNYKLYECLQKLLNHNKELKQQEKDDRTKQAFEQALQSAKSDDIQSNIKMTLQKLKGKYNFKLLNYFNQLRENNKLIKEIEQGELKKQNEILEKEKFAEQNRLTTIKHLLKKFPIKSSSKFLDVLNTLRNYNKDIKQQETQCANEEKELQKENDRKNQEEKRKLQNLAKKLLNKNGNKLNDVLAKLMAFNKSEKQLEKEEQDKEKQQEEETKKNQQRQNACLQKLLRTIPHKQDNKLRDCLNKLQINNIVRKAIQDAEIKSTQEELERQNLNKLKNIDRQINSLKKLFNSLRNKERNAFKILSAQNQEYKTLSKENNNKLKKVFGQVAVKKITHVYEKLVINCLEQMLKSTRKSNLLTILKFSQKFKQLKTLGGLKHSLVCFLIQKLKSNSLCNILNKIILDKMGNVFSLLKKNYQENIENKSNSSKYIFKKLNNKLRSAFDKLRNNNSIAKRNLFSSHLNALTLCLKKNHKTVLRKVMDNWSRKEFKEKIKNFATKLNSLVQRRNQSSFEKIKMEYLLKKYRKFIKAILNLLSLFDKLTTNIKKDSLAYMLE